MDVITALKSALEIYHGPDWYLKKAIADYKEKWKQRQQEKAKEISPKKKITKAKIAIILSAIIALTSSVLVVVDIANRVKPLSSDTLLKYYADQPNDANDNVVVYGVSETSGINHGFYLEIKLTPENSWPDYKDCYYDIYIAPGDARPGGENNFNFATGGVAGFKGLLEVAKRAYIIQPSYTGSPIPFSEYDPSRPQDTDVVFTGSTTTSHVIAIQYEFDLEDIPTAQYSDSQRFYTIAIAVYAPDEATHLGRSDLYTIEYEPVVDGKSEIKGIYVVGLTGKTPISETLYFIKIAIAGISLLVLIGALGILFALKRKQN